MIEFLKKLFCKHEHTHEEGYGKVFCEDCNSYINW